MHWFWWGKDALEVSLKCRLLKFVPHVQQKTVERITVHFQELKCVTMYCATNMSTLGFQEHCTVTIVAGAFFLLIQLVQDRRGFHVLRV
jgi:hypothetical protein